MYNNILVPMALDHNISSKTLEIARCLCTEGGQITALHVYEQPSSAAIASLPEDLLNAGFERARELMQEKLAGVEGVTAKLVKGHSYRTIVDYAEEHGIDCIVMGSHKPGLSDYLIGSTAARVIRHAPCAVHVHRG